jgi:hypothetical protein
MEGLYKFRQGAKQQLRLEFPDIEAAIQAQLADRAWQSTPAIGIGNGALRQ